MARIRGVLPCGADLPADEPARASGAERVSIREGEDDSLPFDDASGTLCGERVEFLKRLPTGIFCGRTKGGGDDSNHLLRLFTKAHCAQSISPKHELRRVRDEGFACGTRLLDRDDSVFVVPRPSILARTA